MIEQFARPLLKTTRIILDKSHGERLMKFTSVPDPFAAQRARYAVGLASTEQLAHSPVPKGTPRKFKYNLERNKSVFRTRSRKQLAGSRLAKRMNMGSHPSDWSHTCDPYNECRKLDYVPKMSTRNELHKMFMFPLQDCDSH